MYRARSMELAIRRIIFTWSERDAGVTDSWLRNNGHLNSLIADSYLRTAILWVMLNEAQAFQRKRCRREDIFRCWLQLNGRGGAQSPRKEEVHLTAEPFRTPS